MMLTTWFSDFSSTYNIPSCDEHHRASILILPHWSLYPSFLPLKCLILFGIFWKESHFRRDCEAYYMTILDSALGEPKLRWSWIQVIHSGDDCMKQERKSGEIRQGRWKTQCKGTDLRSLLWVTGSWFHLGLLRSVKKLMGGQSFYLFTHHSLPPTVWELSLRILISRT